MRKLKTESGKEKVVRSKQKRANGSRASKAQKLVYARAFGVPTQGWTLDDFFNVFCPDFTRPSSKQTFATILYDGRVVVSGNIAQNFLPKLRRLPVRATWDEEKQSLFFETESNPELIDLVLRHIAKVFPNLFLALRTEPKYPKKTSKTPVIKETKKKRNNHNRN